MSVHTNETDLSKRDWSKLLPLIDVSVKEKETAEAIFKVFSTGIDTAKPDLKRDPKSIDAKAKLLTIAYRPFCNLYCSLEKRVPAYTDRKFNALINGKPNYYLVIPYPNRTDSLCCVVTHNFCDKHFFNNTLCIPLYHYNNEGTQLCNVTDSACQLFNNNYGQNDPSSPVCYAGSSELRDEFRLDIPAANPITKEAIFHYVYAVLHYPAYLNEYGANGKQQIPHIPLYNNFHQWATWGKRLVDLHLHYETAPPYPLLTKEGVIDSGTGSGLNSVANSIFKANKEKSEIIIDASTTLYNIPQSAWNYKLGHQSALEWVLDNYKTYETCFLFDAGQYNTDPYTVNKEEVIDLLKRICTVSIETMKIIDNMLKQPVYPNY